MIKLPELFEQKLMSFPSLAADVRKSFDLFEPWLEQSGMPFFPGFTDHSPRHINDVLSTAASLLSDSSHDLLSAEDVAVLCMAILLHDCGMHLTQDAFRNLIEDSDPAIVSGFGDLPWSQLWKDFLGEANRFGQEKLIAIFGDAEPLQLGELNLNDLSERDCLLIGEFVRRHHTRIAHEIAIKGVARKGGVPLELCSSDSDIKNLAGLVARSHGLSIRATFDYIENKYGVVQVYRNVKTPFLMAVLRISDYIQVKSERALNALLSVRELRSPISRQEWLAHFSVRDVHTEDKDPEAFYVHATPTDVRTYLKLEALFRDIQRELDESWAAIGEIYGRSTRLSPLGLTVRRIRSNLDDKEKFAKTVAYIPLRAGFDSSGPDLLKLLVGPLYDYKYKIGIRELLQNSVDACRESCDLASRMSNINFKFNEMPSVVVDIQESEDGTGWITITDTGVGMTLDTVTQYFLIAGASFRNSEIWKRQHIDENGKVHIARGGRFGVGALAAFLLGDEIQVKTRHVNRAEFEGVEFVARIDDPVVELKRCNLPVGTSIKIWISNADVLNELRPYVQEGGPVNENGAHILEHWPDVDWFIQSEPKVKYKWSGFDRMRRDGVARKFLHAEFQSPPAEFVPLLDASEHDWNVLSNPEPYRSILWKYMNHKYTSDDSSPVYSPYESNEITVNGIRVGNFSGYNAEGVIRFVGDDREAAPTHYIRRPSMAIFDPSGLCPINLQRSAVAFDRMGLEGEMAKAIIRKHFTDFKNNLRSFTSLADFSLLCSNIMGTPGVRYGDNAPPICVSRSGIFLAAPKLFAQLKIKKLFFVNKDADVKSPIIMDLLLDDEAILLIDDSNKSGVQTKLAWFRGILFGDASEHYSYAVKVGLPRLRQVAEVFILSSKNWSFYNGKGRVRKDLLNSLLCSDYSKSNKCIISGDSEQVNPLRKRIDEICSVLPPNSEVGGWLLADEQPHAEKTSAMLDIWVDIFEGGVIRA